MRAVEQVLYSPDRSLENVVLYLQKSVALVLQARRPDWSIGLV